MSTAFLDRVPTSAAAPQALAVLRADETGDRAPAVMWGPSIVGFGTHAATRASRARANGWWSGFSPRKAALTIYGVYNDYGPAGPLFDELGPHTTGKGCLYLKSLDGIDLEVLETLVRAAWDRAALPPVGRPG